MALIVLLWLHVCTRQRSSHFPSLCTRLSLSCRILYYFSFSFPHQFGILCSLCSRHQEEVPVGKTTPCQATQHTSTITVLLISSITTNNVAVDHGCMAAHLVLWTFSSILGWIALFAYHGLAINTDIYNIISPNICVGHHHFKIVQIC